MTKEGTEYLKISDFKKDEVKYKIAVTKKRANKRTRIHCEENQIIWEQMYPLGRCPSSEKTNILQPSGFIEKNCICILVISGKPSFIIGLDEGVYSSAKRFSKDIKSHLYVMSKAAFKALDV